MRCVLLCAWVRVSTCALGKFSLCRVYFTRQNCTIPQYGNAIRVQDIQQCACWRSDGAHEAGELLKRNFEKRSSVLFQNVLQIEQVDWEEKSTHDDDNEGIDCAAHYIAKRQHHQYLIQTRVCQRVRQTGLQSLQGLPHRTVPQRKVCRPNRVAFICQGDDFWVFIVVFVFVFVRGNIAPIRSWNIENPRIEGKSHHHNRKTNPDV